jgi:hypothetical protein
MLTHVAAGATAAIARAAMCTRGVAMRLDVAPQKLNRQRVLGTADSFPCAAQKPTVTSTPATVFCNRIAQR